MVDGMPLAFTQEDFFAQIQYSSSTHLTVALEIVVPDIQKYEKIQRIFYFFSKNLIPTCDELKFQCMVQMNR